MQGVRTEEGGHHADTMLVELSIVLVANQNDPSILNPDFLRHNGIVDTGLQLKEPPISTPMFSQAIFEGDVGIRAEPNRFVFEQRGQPLTEDACTIPEISERFLKTVSNVPYSAIGINPRSVKLSNKATRYSVTDTLIEGGKWMSFKDVQPDVHLKAIYNYEKRTITLDVGGVEAKGNDGTMSSGLLFHANIHRNIGANEQGQRIEEVLSILSAWKNDISDFNDLVAKFHAMEISR